MVWVVRAKSRMTDREYDIGFIGATEEAADEFMATYAPDHDDYHVWTKTRIKFGWPQPCADEFCTHDTNSYQICIHKKEEA